MFSTVTHLSRFVVDSLTNQILAQHPSKRAASRALLACALERAPFLAQTHEDEHGHSQWCVVERASERVVLICTNALDAASNATRLSDDAYRATIVSALATTPVDASVGAYPVYLVRHDPYEHRFIVCERATGERVAEAPSLDDAKRFAASETFATHVIAYQADAKTFVIVNRATGRHEDVATRAADALVQLAYYTRDAQSAARDAEPVARDAHERRQQLHDAARETLDRPSLSALVRRAFEAQHEYDAVHAVYETSHHAYTALVDTIVPATLAAAREQMILTVQSYLITLEHYERDLERTAAEARDVLYSAAQTR